MKTVAHARFEFGDQRAEVGGSACPSIVDKVGVISCDMDIAELHSLGSCLFEKPGGGHLALADGRSRDLGGDFGSEFRQQQILENAAGALPGDGGFFIP